MSKMQNNSVEEAASRKAQMHPPEVTRDLTQILSSVMALPKELRTMIFDFTFGNGVLKLSLVCDPDRPSNDTRAVWRTGKGEEVATFPGWNLVSSLQQDGHSIALGALDWMVTCRQGHAEVIESIFESNVLKLSERFYSTNLPAISYLQSQTQPQILFNIVDLIPREFLARVRSADLFWTLPCFGKSIARILGDEHIFAKLLESLVIALPRLKTLSLQVNSHSSLHTLMDGGEQVMTDVLAPLNKMLRQYDNLDCSLSLDLYIYGDVRRYLWDKYPDKVQPLTGRRGFWWDVGDGIGCSIWQYSFDHPNGLI